MRRTSQKKYQTSPGRKVKREVGKEAKQSKKLSIKIPDSIAATHTSIRLKDFFMKKKADDDCVWERSDVMSEEKKEKTCVI